MPFKAAFKVVHGIVTAVLLIIVAGMWWLNQSGDNRATDKLQHVTKINDHMWLYMTESQTGGATVPNNYRFYLAGELKGSASEIVKSLAEGYPFLSGNGAISDITANADNRVTVTYTGKVFSLGESSTYTYNGQNITAPISYHIN